MTFRGDRPGRALHRMTGAGAELPVDRNFRPEAYASDGDLQARHVRHRCGVTDHRARLIAALCFGEGGR